MPPNHQITQPNERRVARFASQRWQRRNSTLRSVRGCHTALPDRAPGLMVSSKSAGYCNLRRCGSVWACEVCAAKVREERSKEVERMGKAWLDSGGQLLFATFTGPHYSNEPLKTCIDRVMTAYRSVWGGAAVAGGVNRDGWGDANGYLGQVRVVESTWSPDNGWHVHIHALLFVRGDDLRQSAYNFLFPRWCDQYVKNGGKRPSVKHGLDIRGGDVTGEGTIQLGKYLQKLEAIAPGAAKENQWGVGREMMRADMKRSKSSVTPWQMLAAAMVDGHSVKDGDCACSLGWRVCPAHLWAEWERATKGRRCMMVSKAVRLMAGVEALTDEQIAEAELDKGVLVAQFDQAAWRDFTNVPGLLAAMLDEALAAGYRGVLDAVKRLAPELFEWVYPCDWGGSLLARAA